MVYSGIVQRYYLSINNKLKLLYNLLLLLMLNLLARTEWFKTIGFNKENLFRLMFKQSKYRKLFTGCRAQTYQIFISSNFIAYLTC